jgi:predicted DNA-binding transcriptional regulator AlpA
MNKEPKLTKTLVPQDQKFGIEPDKFYTTGELAHATGLSVACYEAWRFRDDGSGPPFIRLGRRAARYVGADVIAWLMRNRVTTVP